MQKRISPEIKLKIISLSGKMFWFWKSFYNFYSAILGISSRELERKIPRSNYNKYEATEKIIEDLESQNKTDLQKHILSEIYRLSSPFDKEDNPKYEEAKQELNELKKIIGVDVLEEDRKKDAFRKRIEKNKKESELEKAKNQQINTIKEKFFEKSMSTDRQNAGYWLEGAFFDILDLEKVENTRSYKTQSEQIDGHFKYNKFDYLVEIKWTSERVKQKEVSIFDGKIKRKAQSTRGVILSISGFDESAVFAASSNSPRIIFIDVQDWINILERRTTFLDLFKTKEDNLVRLGKVYNLNK